MESLADDLVLLSIRPGNGLIASNRLGYGLMGSELVRLAASRRVDITGDRIVVLDGGPTGDEQLDAALASIWPRRPPRPKAWVSKVRPRICDAYLARLAAAGAIRQERDRVMAIIPVIRWRITDAARAADARARLDAIVHASGRVDTWQAAFAGLASASGLSPVLYPGRGNRELRKRLDQIAQGEWTTPVATGPGGDPSGLADRQIADAALAATRAASDAAARATEAATQAATDAAVQAATQAATHAAVSAAVHAAHDAAGHSGGHDGGGGGGGHH